MKTQTRQLKQVETNSQVEGMERTVRSRSCNLMILQPSLLRIRMKVEDDR